MRIASVTHYTELYGANRSLLDLIDGLKRYGVDSCVVCPDQGPVVDALREREVAVRVVPMASWMSLRSSGDGLSRRVFRWARSRMGAIKRLCFNLWFLPVLARQLRSWGAELVHTNSSVIPSGALVAKSLGLPHVWHIRELWDLHYGLRPDWGDRVFKRAVSSADAVIAVSEAVRTHLVGDEHHDRVHVIHDGVAWEADFDRLRGLARLHSNIKGDYRFALVGLIHEAKGQEEAVRALAIAADRFPAVRLLIAGGGDTSRLEQTAAELDVADKVDFLGYVQDPFGVYLKADAVLMCSRSEAMGRVTAEAMAACRPVIGRDSGGTAELVEDGHTGLLYSGGPESLAACMMGFVEAPEFARQLGENGWLAARGKYTIEAYSDAVYRVLYSVTDVPACA
jgi:glycosyltransferase involved in cell wall biosynthesis